MRLILSRIFWYCGRKIFASCELGRVARTMSALSFGNSGVASKVLRTMELMESLWTGGSAELGIQGVAGAEEAGYRLRCVAEFLGPWCCIVPKFHIQISQ